MLHNVAVIGSGVIGLSTALHLRRRGHTVTVFTDESRLSRTSAVAAAFWYPYAVDLGVEEERELAEPGFRFYLDEAMSDPGSGVNLGMGLQYFDDHTVADDRPVPWWAVDAGLAPHTRFRELAVADLPQPAGEELGTLNHGWSFQVPIIHAATFLGWLRRAFLAAGGEIRDNLHVTSLEAVTLSKFDVVVNCAGGWSTRLVAARYLFGLQGVIIRIPKAEYDPPALVFLEHGRCVNPPIYIVPHRDAPTVLGGTVEPVTAPGEPWKLDDKSKWIAHPIHVRQVLRRCALIDPTLIRFIGREDTLEAVAGLRPRRQNKPPRIELDADLSRDGRKVIHNYGHGGAGFTLFEGSAVKVAELIDM